MGDIEEDAVETVEQFLFLRDFGKVVVTHIIAPSMNCHCIVVLVASHFIKYI